MNWQLPFANDKKNKKADTARLNIQGNNFFTT